MGHVGLRGERDLLDVSLQPVVQFPETEAPTGGQPPARRAGAGARAAAGAAGARLGPGPGASALLAAAAPGLMLLRDSVLRDSVLNDASLAVLSLKGGGGGAGHGVPAGHRTHRGSLSGPPHLQQWLHVLVLAEPVQVHHLHRLPAEVGVGLPQRDLGLSYSVVIVELPVMVEHLEDNRFLLNIIRGELEKDCYWGGGSSETDFHLTTKLNSSL